MKSDATFLGLIRRVIGAKILVELSVEQLPSANPIIHGRIYRLGQVGSFVRIPLGFLNIYGIVSMVGASEIKHPENIDLSLYLGQRWIEIQLIGESYGKEDFKRGVSVFPTIDDEVHLVTDEDLRIIFGGTGPNLIRIGTHATSESLSANIDIDKLITRHGAILGATGSGKSNTVAAILKSITAGQFPNAQIILIDPHGEYGAALADRAKVFSIDSKTNPLLVPYWALSFDELGWLLIDRKTATESVQDILLRDNIHERKKSICNDLKAGKIDSNDITADSPIPFNLIDLWFDVYFKEYATLMEKDNWNTIAYKKDDKGNLLKGDKEKLIPPSFEPPGPGGKPPFNPPTRPNLASYLNRILGRLKDRRFDFLLKPGKYNGTDFDLDELLNEWLNHQFAITVLDLAGIPSEIMDIIVGVVSRILFEGMFWGRDLPGVGRARPLFLVYEEAHNYLPKGGSGQFVSGFAIRMVRRIFKEGRKYGIGALVVSQRPSELDETILSQCGTFFALRLSNSDDQGRIRSSVPDYLGGIIDILPALRTGEAIVLGEAVQIPSRIRLPLIEPRPRSDDPITSKEWAKKKVDEPPYNKAITNWRNQRISKEG